jgi:hypothetical protein
VGLFIGGGEKDVWDDYVGEELSAAEVRINKEGIPKGTEI